MYTKSGRYVTLLKSYVASKQKYILHAEHDKTIELIRVKNGHIPML